MPSADEVKSRIEAAIPGAEAVIETADETPFTAVDVLPDPRIRAELSAISQWPTIPQLFHKGELIGGCDIVTEMYDSGELAEVLGAAPVAGPVAEPAISAQPAPMGIENRL